MPFFRPRVTVSADFRNVFFPTWLLIEKFVCYCRKCLKVWFSWMAPIISSAIWTIKRFACVCITCKQLLLHSFQLIFQSNLVVFTLELLLQNSVNGAKLRAMFSDLRIRANLEFLEQFSH